MNIVMFTDAYWPRVNGVTVSVDSFSRALIRAGHDVMIVCSFYPEGMHSQVSLLDSPEEQEGPKIVRVPSLPILITKEDRIAKFNKWHWVFRQVEIFNPQIIHINTEMMIAGFGFMYASAHNLPVIYTFHTMWEDYAPNYVPMLPSFMVRFIIRGWQKSILAGAYRVIVPTPQIKDVVHKYDPKVKTFQLPTGIETELFEHDRNESAAFREKLERHFPRLKGKRLLLFAGRVAKEKNIGFLLKILPGILARHPDIVLLIVGNGPDLEYYREMAKKTGIEEACVFTGYLERKDLALAYTISEVFVFPSLTDTQGLVTLEAMLSGTPVVAIGVLGTLMVMGGDNGGFMVKKDKAEFSARVLQLLEDGELHRQKSLEAVKHASQWSIVELTKKLVNIYDSTVKAYSEEHGEPRTPLWEYVMDKRWWEVNNKIIKKRAYRKWHAMMTKLNKQLTELGIWNEE